MVDHVVALTDALPRTTEALEDAGFELRRVAGPMAFFRFGECILELVERWAGARRCGAWCSWSTTSTASGRWWASRATRCSPGGGSPP